MESTVIAIDVANNFFSIILAILSILGILVGVIFWFARLESMSKANEKAIIALELASAEKWTEHKTEVAAKDKVMWEKIDTLQSSMNQVLVMVGKIEGKINTK